MESVLMATQCFPSPIGTIEVTASDRGVTRVQFVDSPRAAEQGNRFTEQCAVELAEYFAGQRQAFSVALDPQGTAFQQQVWRQLRQIPYGQSASYQAIAAAIARPKAVRAVGAANGRNPIGILVPCHRVIGASGRLTGYAGGLERKAWLLQHEGIAFKAG